MHRSSSREPQSVVQTAFASLRHLHVLDAALARLEADGAFEPMRRTDAVRFVVGQRLEHRVHGPCVVYGWDHACDASEPPTAEALERAGGASEVGERLAVAVGAVAHGHEPVWGFKGLSTHPSIHPSID